MSKKAFFLFLSACIAFSSCTKEPAPEPQPEPLDSSKTYLYANAISGGVTTSSAVLDNGSVICWGSDFGSGTNLSNITSVSTGSNYAIAIKSDGTVWSWGDNTWGQLGDSTSGYHRWNPVKVTGLNAVSAISAGYMHSLALRTDGTVWSWGFNSEGQLGDSSTQQKNAPVKVKNLLDIIAVSAGQWHSLALKIDGTVWTWGNEPATGIKDSIPVQVPGVSNIIAISAGGNFSVALRNDGTVWAWGINDHLQLGICNYSNSAIPVQVSGLTNIKAIDAGYAFGLAIRNDSTVWGWGHNAYGNLGDGTAINNKCFPVQAMGLTSIVAIDAGLGEFSLALKKDGSAWAWGNSTQGQVGPGTFNSYKKTPTQVIKP